MRLPYLFRVLVGSAALGSAACGATLPPPPNIAHVRSSFMEVPYPPAAALAETVPARPDGDPYWVDGSWEFRGKSYSWRRGGWVIPPEGARYARSEVVFELDGRILFAPAAWYDKSGTILDSVRPRTPAATPPNEYTAESQTPR